MSRRAAWVVFALWGVASAQSYKPAAVAQANRGLEQARKGDYAAAIRAYKAAVAIDPGLPGIYLNLGLAWFKGGDFRQAFLALTKADADQPTSQTATLLAMCNYGLGQFREAADRLQPLVAAQPENQELAYTLARSYLLSGQHAQALELFRTMLRREPDSAPVHMLLGEALDASYQPAEAIAEFETAASRGSDLPDVHFGLGYLYWKQKRFDDAEKQFREELKNDPGHARASAWLGDTLMKTDRPAAAVDQLRLADRLDGKLSMVHFDLGVLYAAVGRNEEARTELLETIRLVPDDYAAHYRLARLYQALGKTAEANAQFAIVKHLHEKKDGDSLIQIGNEKAPPVRK